MINMFDAAVVAGYSIILTWIIDFLSKTKVGVYVTGPYKQLLSGVLGIIYCISQKVIVVGEGLLGEIMTGLLLASVAGVGWSKIQELLRSTKK